MKLDRADLDSLHDTIFNALDMELKSDAEIIEYWNKLPRDIQLDIETYGASDTPTRESIYEHLIKNKMKRYLCYQLIVTKEERLGTNNNIEMSAIVRDVGAASEEEAIGKFILNTRNNGALRKLNVDCFELNTLKKID